MKNSDIKKLKTQKHLNPLRYTVNCHQLWTWNDLSDFLQIGIPTLKKWVFQRRIPVIRLGEGKRRLLRFRLTDIDKWIEDHNELPRY